MKDDVELGFVTPQNVSHRSVGDWFFTTLLTHLPDAMPGRYGNYEPLEMKHVGSGVGNLSDSWANPFLWAKGKPRVRGAVWFGKGIRHSSLRMTLESARFDVDNVVDLFVGISAGLEIDFGYVHLFTLEELTDRSRYNKVMPFRRGVMTVDLEEGIPDVPSVMILGKPYLDLFGARKVLSSPAAKTIELENGAVLLQACSDLRASKDCFADFDERRNALKCSLGVDAFLGEGRSAARLPEFRFEDL